MCCCAQSFLAGVSPRRETRHTCAMAISLLGRAQGQYRSSMAMQQLQFSARGRAWAAPARRQARSTRATVVLASQECRCLTSCYPHTFTGAMPAHCFTASKSGKWFMRCSGCTTASRPAHNGTVRSSTITRSSQPTTVQSSNCYTAIGTGSGGRHGAVPGCSTGA